MQKQVRIAAISLGLLIVIAVLLVAWNGGLAGFVAGLKDKNLALGVAIDVPTDVYAEDGALIQATAEKKLVSVTFETAKGACPQALGEDTEAPYEVQWTPSCGDGEYVITAVGRHASGKTERVSVTRTVTHRLREVTLSTQQFRGGPVTSSATVYPPSVGSSPSQTLARAQFPAPETDGERIIVNGTITMRKTSGGVFDGEFRVIGDISGETLISEAVSDPTTPTTVLFQGSMSLVPGRAVDSKLQFRSTEDFSAITVDSFAMTVTHVGLR
jgi:hypothetical protein